MDHDDYMFIILYDLNGELCMINASYECLIGLISKYSINISTGFAKRKYGRGPRF